MVYSKASERRVRMGLGRSWRSWRWFDFSWLRKALEVCSAPGLGLVIVPVIRERHLWSDFKEKRLVWVCSLSGGIVDRCFIRLM